ncbi:mechanosensitive ion channel family protein [Thalassotalea aquiviva]|uniref:mechanosensitive ion channel family protein n=1 Tax=Thalassotalea aquiviva TaxID=3242415 RepID=UPI00352B48B0
MEEVLNQLTEFFQLIWHNPILRTGSLLLLTFFGAWLVAMILDRVIISRLRSFASKAKFAMADELIGLLQKPLYYTIFVFAFIFGNSILEIAEFVSTIVIPILNTLLLVIWTSFFLKITKILLRLMAHNESKFEVVNPQTLPVFQNLALIIIWVVAIYYILSSWNIDMSALLASAGIVGIAVGFAARDTLANLFSGVFIMADAPYKIGDYIVLESGERGAVTHIGLRSTRILTRDNIELTVPNSVIGNTKVTNESGGPNTTYRIRCKVGVAYGSDIDQVREILQKVAEDEPDISAFPNPVVRFRHFGNSSLDFEVMGWIKDPQFRGRITDQILTAIYKRFSEADIEIPYSKHDLYIKEHVMTTSHEASKTPAMESPKDEPKKIEQKNNNTNRLKHDPADDRHSDSHASHSGDDDGDNGD